MRVTERMKKWISMILCLCMLVQNAPMMVFAASTDNLCEHHPKHTEDCGYVEAVAGFACTHEHSEACYEIVECKHTCSDECDDPCTTHTCTVDDGCITMERDCHHIHGECGYAEAVEPQDCTTCQPVLVHAQNCGYVESADEVTCACEPTMTHGGEGCTYVEGKDGSSCTHVCAVVVDSDDSCYKLLCSHKDDGHDDACGYVAAVEGHACHYECTACEADADDEEPEIPEIAEGVCAHGNSEENCETCVAEIQVMINALPDMEDITDENRADVISRMEAIDSRKWKLSDAARGKLDFDKYSDAAFVLSTPPNFFGFAIEKRYEVGASEMPQASFAFLDASGMAATVITAEGMETTSVEPVSNGGAVRGYLPVGEYTLDETVTGDWNLTMSVNGQADDDHTFTGEGGRAYRIETINSAYCVIQLTPSENGSVGLTADGGEWEEDCYVVKAGRTVTLTVTPASGYELDDLEVKPESADKQIVLTPSGNTYTFEAPAETVTVTATFKLHEHEFDSTTGKCTACETEMAVASVKIGDTTTYFETLADAVTEAEDGTAEALATLTLLQDIDLEDSSQEINSGVMTLDLNGCTLTGSGESVLHISGTETLKPDVTITGGTITSALFGVVAENSDVTITGGTISSGQYGVLTASSTVTITGGTISSGQYGVHAASSTVTITGGKISCSGNDLQVSGIGSIILGLGENDTGATFPGGLKVSGTTLKKILDEDAAYWQDGKMLTNIADNATEISGGDVTVKEVCEHENATYQQITDTQHMLVCSKCGYKVTEDHTFNPTTGQCTDCITASAVASVKIGDTTTCFATLAGAVGAAKTGTAEAPATLTLLKNIDLGESSQEIKSGVFTLDLNGYTLTGSGSYVLYIRNTETHVTITDGSEAGTGTISGTGTGTTTSSGCQGVRVYQSTLTIKNGTISGTSDGVFVIYGDLSVAGGTVSGDVCGVNARGTVAEISGGTITATGEGSVGVYAYESSNVQISGGTITGGYSDLQTEGQGTRITLTLGKNNTGATFPGGLNVEGAKLKAILGEDAAYWQGTKMLTNIADDATVITGGTVTVKAVCEHTDVTYPEADIEDTTHKKVCPCGYEATENHTFVSATGECQYCKTKIAVAMVEIGGTTPTYFETLYEAVTKAGTGTAEAPATLTLLQDIDLEDSSQEINSGVMTLDLNGCTLTGSHSSYGVLYLNGCNLTITDGSAKQDGTNTDGSAEQGGTISGGVCGVYATNKSTLIITGGTISGGYGVNAHDNSTVKISGGTITGTNFGVNANKSTVTISGGEVSSNGQYSYGVYANESAVTINGGKISATGKSSCGVYASSNSTVKISGGKITGNGESSVGVYASYNGKVEISGGTITGTNSGVHAYSNSNVTINGGTVSGDGYGVNAMECTVKISGGTITGSANSAIGVNIVNGTVEISSSTISGYCGVYASSNSTVKISSSTISGYCGVLASYNSTVKISGGTITGVNSDLMVQNNGSITLGLDEDGIGATFPGGLKVSGTTGTTGTTSITLKAILAEGAAYWQGTKMLTNIADNATEISGGDVTVKAVCEHENATYQQITDTQHTLVCSECLYSVTENHTLTYTASGNVITESCSECNETLGTATITANGKTYNGEPVTAAVQKTGVLIDSNIGITYSQNGEDLNESVINAGTYTASIKLGDAEATVEFTITPATLPDAVLSETGYTYNGQQQKPDVTVTGLTENTDYTVTYPQDVTNAGEKTVTITGKGNYTGTVTKSYSIAKADSVVTKAPQAAANLVYNGKNQNLVSAGTVTGGTLQYSLDGKTWAATIPVGKAAGTYTVSYKVVGDANHKDIAVRTLAVTIAKGTAPAVDTLIQTHFYAYATENTVDLTKYLPADRGTTAYTVVGVSADIFSGIPAVTNAGVLSYTTRKLTAAPASDTQIRIKAVMENYADAELTVTVKLLAVTEQTQQKIVKAELTEVPDGLAGTRFNSVDAIKAEQKRVLGLLLGYDPQGNILHYDVKLQFSPDGGKTWVDATKENFPANGLTVTLPYPSGTGKDTHNFVVGHMFTTGAKAGTIETPAVTKTADGIQFTVTGLSPVSVAWSAIPFDVNVANVTNGTVYVSSAQATAGTQVTITATPKSGYRLSSLTVKDAAGNFCVVSTDNNGKYYFTMPAADVTVTATFTAKSTAVADTTNPKTGDDFPILFWSGMMMTTLLGAAALMLNKKKFYER